jgi:hypothetical protein
MPELDYIWVTSEPPCCPDAYWCQAAQEVECPRHGGFDVCCDQTESHAPQDRDAWHESMESWEQQLLNQHIQRLKILQAYELDDDPIMSMTLSTLI